MTVYVFIDVQNDFITGALANPAALSALSAIKEVRDEALAANCPMIWTRDTHDSNYLNTQEGKNLPIPHTIKGEWGWQIIDGLAVKGNIYFLNKEAFGAKPIYWQERFNDICRDYKQTITKIVFCGFVSSICVISNIMIVKALYPEVEIEFRANASAGLTPEDHTATCKVLECCQVKILYGAIEKVTQ